jgi:hypothetical protein
VDGVLKLKGLVMTKRIAEWLVEQVTQELIAHLVDWLLQVLPTLWL